MCRILGIDADEGTVRMFLNALVSAARSDPFNHNKSHSDGWGAAFCYNGQRPPIKIGGLGW